MFDLVEFFLDILELNIGGVFYIMVLVIVKREGEFLLGQIFNGSFKVIVVKDLKGKYFIDRDGVLFRYVFDYFRNQKIVLLENFYEKERFK